MKGNICTLLEMSICEASESINFFSTLEIRHKIKGVTILNNCTQGRAYSQSTICTDFINQHREQILQFPGADINIDVVDIIKEKEKYRSTKYIFLNLEHALLLPLFKTCCYSASKPHGGGVIWQVHLEPFQNRQPKLKIYI